METINERFRNARIALDLSQEKFAEAANRTRSEIKNIEYGKTAPTENIVKAVCSAHNINRRYLELGEEPMFLPELDPDTDYINELLSDNDSPFVDIIRSILREYMELPKADRKKFDDFINGIIEKRNQKDRD